jgi:hypothetical protein
MWRLLISDFKKGQKVLNKRQKPEKVRKKTKHFPLCGKRQKYLAKFPPFEYTFAGFEVSCRRKGGQFVFPRCLDFLWWWTSRRFEP